MRGGRRYRSLFDIDIRDYKGWAYGLKKAGYATLPTYAEKLIDIIGNYKLYKYDSMTLTEEQNELLAYKISAARGLESKDDFVNTVRHVKAASMSLEQISKKFKIPVAFLLEYNDLETTSGLQKNQIVYLERKKIKITQGKQIHIVRNGDTPYSISQKYGIRLKWLCKRNKIKKDDILEQGTQVYLRGFKFIERI